MSLKVKKNPSTRHPKAEALERYETTRFAVNLPVHLHRALKVHAAQTGNAMTDIVVEQIRAYLAQQGELAEQPNGDEETG